MDETKEKYESPTIEPAERYTGEVGAEAPLNAIKDE